MGTTGFKNEIDRLFDRLAELKGNEPLALGDWAPSMDVSETKDSLVCTVEVPGMEEKDLQVSLQENLLTIKGEKRKEREEKDEHYHRVERSYGEFERSFRFSTPIRGDEVKASYKDGVLEVRVPKAEEAKAREIEVQAG
ncbi:MAG TPA: Hsp20/alpha crystallin family protein [Methylomirabilota bacterium]